MLVAMRRIGLSAAGLVVAFALGLSYATDGRAKVSLEHTCSVVDRQFIETARTNMAAINLWGQDYLNGDAQPKEVVKEARDAAKILHATDPTDPSLTTTRNLLFGMFTEYGKAIEARALHKDAGPHMYRAYGLANFAHSVLEDAAPALAKRGCDIAPLL